MNDQNSFSIILLTCAFMLFLTSWWYLKRTPKYSKSYKGLTKSKYEGRSKAHWDFSHIYGGTLYFKLAIVLLILGVLGFFIDFGFMIGFIMAITIVCIGITIIRIKVDNALIDRFGK
ncbi:SdpI family protein [Flavobacteriaceae bacterium 144Ye]|uniref:SdpI family protein n=1 Tax=Gaetbulibacter sp. NE TaxID=2982307 RepID=UPI00101B6B05|nr:SdpI family protein [Gaetbulibacter sp. NE]RYH75647.1 SdpI family protein [Flavobacteriaceae bacterium 144Ye]